MVTSCARFFLRRKELRYRISNNKKNKKGAYRFLFLLTGFMSKLDNMNNGVCKEKEAPDVWGGVGDSPINPIECRQKNLVKVLLICNAWKIGWISKTLERE